jgi:hypothetical protein
MLDLEGDPCSDERMEEMHKSARDRSYHFLVRGMCQTFAPLPRQAHCEREQSAAVIHHCARSSPSLVSNAASNSTEQQDSWDARQ